MSSHPEHLYRAQQLRHAELLARYGLERQARIAPARTHRLRRLMQRAHTFLFSGAGWAAGSTVPESGHELEPGPGGVDGRDLDIDLTVRETIIPDSALGEVGGHTG